MINYYQLKNYTAMTVKGANSKELLQGQVSCDLNVEKDYYDGLFCDEKGYVITNATILFDEYYYIIAKDEVSAILISELKKFGQFFDCSIEEEKKDILGQELNGELKKLFGRKDICLNSEEVCPPYFPPILTDLNSNSAKILSSSSSSGLNTKRSSNV